MLYPDVQNPLEKLNEVPYLDAHILDICATLEDLHMKFSEQLSYHKLLTHIFMLHFDTS